MVDELIGKEDYMMSMLKEQTNLFKSTPFGNSNSNDEEDEEEDA